MSDYDRIAQAIAFIDSRVGSQPALEDVAAHVHMSPYHFQRLFCRWTGVTPKRFLHVLTLEQAKPLLNQARPLLEVSDALGLSSGSRLYDHFVHLEAVTPGEYKSAGTGLSIEYGVQDTPFGTAFIALTPRGICHLAFPDRSQIDAQVAEVSGNWPQAVLRPNRPRTAAVIKALFARDKQRQGPLSLSVSGTNFQVSVWKALLRIPPGTRVSYAQVAAAIGRPRSARAVGTAVGANPVAFVIPCHRVIRQCGTLGGYRWGETRKRAMQLWEAARCEP